MIITLLTSYIVYILFPTYIERPNVQGSGWQFDLIRFIYNNDHVNNAFPSGHTYTTMLIFFIWWDWRPRWRWLWAAIVIIILLSILFTGQHHLVDPFGGLLWGWLGYRFGTWWEERGEKRAMQ